MLDLGHHWQNYLTICVPLMIISERDGPSKCGADMQSIGSFCICLSCWCNFQATEKKSSCTISFENCDDFRLIGESSAAVAPI
jgi:hypothetical protein